MKISVVIPCLNEEANLQTLVKRLQDVARLHGGEWDFLFVDDGSTDRTAEVIIELAKADARIKLIQFSRNFGHQIALTAGLDHAEGDAVIVMDADLQHPPEILGEFLQHWRAGHDIVYSVRKETQGISLFKRFTAAFFYLLFRRLSKIPLDANAADFRLFDRKVVLAFRQIRERTRFLRGLTAWVGFRTKAVPFVAAERKAGVTKYNLKRMLQFAMDGITSFSAAPLHFAIYLGLSVSVLGFLYGLYALFIRFFTNQAVSGWTSLVVVMVVMGGIQIFLLGLLGLYLGKIYEEVKQRPLYLIQRKVGLSNKIE